MVRWCGWPTGKGLGEFPPFPALLSPWTARAMQGGPPGWGEVDSGVAAELTMGLPW